jgi:DNA mismatch repair ATPase MutL
MIEKKPEDESYSRSNMTLIKNKYIKVSIVMILCSFMMITIGYYQYYIANDQFNGFNRNPVTFQKTRYLASTTKQEAFATQLEAFAKKEIDFDLFKKQVVAITTEWITYIIPNPLDTTTTTTTIKEMIDKLKHIINTKFFANHKHNKYLMMLWNYLHVMKVDSESLEGLKSLLNGNKDNSEDMLKIFIQI